MRRLVKDVVERERDVADPGTAWMLRYQRGDEQAFDLLVETYSPRIHALLTRFLGAVPQREDLLQEVFLRVIRARRRWVPEGRFSTWLYSIVFHLCVNETERRRTGTPLADDEGEQSDERAPGPMEALERVDRVQAVREALAALPPRQRMALVLAKYEGLSLDEVARATGSTEQAVKSMVHRARETLRERLAPFLEDAR
jgi:RNA polymerase sigma-70 factor (ECF subfamily)